jgi:hypothetical protein
VLISQEQKVDSLPCETLSQKEEEGENLPVSEPSAAESTAPGGEAALVDQPVECPQVEDADAGSAEVGKEDESTVREIEDLVSQERVEEEKGGSVSEARDLETSVAESEEVAVLQNDLEAEGNFEYSVVASIYLPPTKFFLCLRER